MKRWYLATKKADFNLIASTYHIDPVIARIIINRGVTDINKYLNGTIKDLYNPFLLKDMDTAVFILKSKIKSHAKIRIVGDYDVDGVASTTMLYKAILDEGGNVDYVIPDRITDGYGINIRIIEDAIRDAVDTIITCDNGIAASEQIAYAKEHNITVIITDHHEIPYEEENGVKKYIIPTADAVVNPKQADCVYPFKGLCGAAVVYKLIQALKGDSLPDEYIALASCGTVCDVMELIDENRIIVKEGLKVLDSNTGLKALKVINGLELKKINSYHMGFIIGPCINATGRIDTALKAVKLLCETDMKTALSMAEELKELNDERKNLTTQGIQDAIDYIDTNNLNHSKVFVIPLQCHESIAGIIAGKIREKYNRPVIIITKVKEGYKGSGRSVPVYDMYQELNKCKNILDKFGGHKLAAGLSLKDENVSLLQKKLNDNCHLTEKEFEEKVLIDVPMPLSYVTETLIEQFEVLEPFGNGNEKPTFAQKDLFFVSGQKMGKEKNVGKFRVTDGNKIYTVMNFNDNDTFDQFINSKFGHESVEKIYSSCNNDKFPINVLYYPNINEFRGIRDIQFIMKEYC